MVTSTVAWDTVVTIRTCICIKSWGGTGARGQRYRTRVVPHRVPFFLHVHELAVLSNDQLHQRVELQLRKKKNHEENHLDISQFRSEQDERRQFDMGEKLKRFCLS